jgi:hypothetical protein
MIILIFDFFLLKSAVAVIQYASSGYTNPLCINVETVVLYVFYVYSSMT